MTVKSRGWVKNVAIVFLSVLLVLTFFSNTIMNYSLPEVAGIYAGYGTIKSAIRGQGTVIANESHSVQISETRQIKEILVKAGELVEAGQVLFLLEESESDELKAAIKALDELNLALSKKMLQMRPADYGEENRAIELLQQEIEELEASKIVAAEHKLALDAAKLAVKEATAVVEAITAEQTAIDEKIAALASTDEFDYEKLLTGEIIKLREELEVAKEEQKAAQKALEQAESALANDTSGDNVGGAVGIASQIAEKRSQLTSLSTGKEQLKSSALALIEATYSSGGPPAYDEYVAARNDIANDQARYEQAVAALLSPSVHSDPDIIARLTEYYNMDSQIYQLEVDISRLEDDLYNAHSSSNVNAQLKNNVTKAKAKLDTAKEKTEEAQKAYDRSLKILGNTFKEQLAAKKLEVKAAQSVLDDKKDVQKELEESTVQKPEEIDASIKTKQRDIESKLFALAQKKDDDGVTRAIADLDLQADRAAIDEQEDVVEKLRAKAQNTEVTSRYAGIITAVNCIVGDKVEPGKDLATLDIAGKGFSISFSVTNQQAQRVQVGNSTTITRWSSDPIQVTLTAIRIDPQSQGRQKILEFAVDGPVNVGETLEITIGERDQSYDCVLPNSAIREDADGTFVLATETKSTPLGNRYTAVRLDVVVLAKDDTNTALQRDTFERSEFIITTATKPVEPGTQVRLTNR